MDLANKLQGFFSSFNYKIHFVSEGRQNVVLPTIERANFDESLFGSLRYVCEYKLKGKGFNHKDNVCKSLDRALLIVEGLVFSYAWTEN